MKLCALACLCLRRRCVLCLVCFVMLCWCDYSRSWRGRFDVVVSAFVVLTLNKFLRLDIQDPELNSKMDNFSFEGNRITNFEMETSAIYGLSALLGHQALSLNAIIANRASGTFSNDPYKAVDELIKYSLNKLSE